VVESRFRIGPEIVHETVDGEVIAIDLGNGSYYSLSGSGPEIWALLSAGATEAEICAALLAGFEADAETVGGEVPPLLAELRGHGLIVQCEDASQGPPPGSGPEGEKRPYESPRLERYTDMKDYFLLDPIHEVDAAGWPQPAA
jgi:hypothetical protein